MELNLLRNSAGEVAVLPEVSAELIARFATEHCFDIDHPVTRKIVDDVQSAQTEGWQLLHVGKVRQIYERSSVGTG